MSHDTFTDADTKNKRIERAPARPMLPDGDYYLKKHGVEWYQATNAGTVRFHEQHNPDKQGRVHLDGGERRIAGELGELKLKKILTRSQRSTSAKNVKPWKGRWTMHEADKKKAHGDLVHSIELLLEKHPDFEVSTRAQIREELRTHPKEYEYLHVWHADIYGDRFLRMIGTAKDEAVRSLVRKRQKRYR